MLNLLLPKNCFLPKTYNKLIKEIDLKQTEIKEIKYCVSCSDKIVREFCTNSQCKEKSIIKGKFVTFKYVDTKSQFEDLIDTYFDNIIEFLNHKPDFIDLSSNIKYDMDNLTLNLVLYTDGVQITKNPVKSIWPVFCSIVELPPILRNSNINKIICGNWEGLKKPSSNILFENLISQMKNYELNGIILGNKHSLRRIYLKFYGIFCDIPAKCMLMNMTYFNGYFSCPYCFIKGSYLI